MNTQSIRILLQKKISELGLNWYVHTVLNKAEIFGPNRDISNDDLIGWFEITNSSVFLVSSTTEKTNLEHLASLQNELLSAIESDNTPRPVNTGTLNQPEYIAVPVTIIASAVIGLITVICLGLIVSYCLFG